MTLSSLTTATVQIPFSQIFSLFVESIACQVVFFFTDSPWIYMLDETNFTPKI